MDWVWPPCGRSAPTFRTWLSLYWPPMWTLHWTCSSKKWVSSIFWQKAFHPRTWSRSCEQLGLHLTPPRIQNLNQLDNVCIWSVSGRSVLSDETHVKRPDASGLYGMTPIFQPPSHEQAWFAKVDALKMTSGIP